jgi:UDPglucose 6-dehydrogenase
VRFLAAAGERSGTPTPLLEGVRRSNERHTAWLQEKVRAALGGARDPVAAVLGLTYKPGTSTLRRSASVALCRWLRAEGVSVRAHDPAVAGPPPEMDGLGVVLCGSPNEAVRGADVAVVATDWPEYQRLGPEDFLRAMRRPQVIDPGWFLAATLAPEPRITYVATGRAFGGSGAKS